MPALAGILPGSYRRFATGMPQRTGWGAVLPRTLPNLSCCLFPGFLIQLI